VIPQNSPAAGYAEHKEQIDAAIARVMNSGSYILGKEVEDFENAFATYVGVKAGVGVASGTDAIEIALRSCGVGPGDVVFTVSHTSVATVVGIERTGASVALVDVDKDAFTMSPESLERVVRSVSNTGAGWPAAVVPVHLYGQMADMPAIGQVAGRHELVLVEDCAQAHGALLEERKAGAWGRAAAFSFYPTKNLAAFGDGGMVVTDEESVADRARQLRQYGWEERFVSKAPGSNSRLDELQAAILSVRLNTLDRDNKRRRAIARAYDDALDECRLGLPWTRPITEHVYHQYVIRSNQRDQIRTFLKNCGIYTAIHYPRPVHQQPAYAARLIGCDQLPVTDEITPQIVSLPMYPQLTNEQVGQIIQTVRAWNAS